MSEAGAQWYYSVGGQRTGPISGAELKAFATAGKLTATDLVWKDGMAEWVPAGKIKGLLPPPPSNGPPPLPPPGPPPLAVTEAPLAAPPAAAAAATPAGAARTAVLVMSIIGGFCSIFVGGCTGAVGSGLSKASDGISDFQSKYGRYSDAADSRRTAASAKSMGESHAAIGFLQGVTAIAAGVCAFLWWQSGASFGIAGRRFRRLAAAGAVLLLMALVTIHNTCAFISAGALYAVSGALALLHARRASPTPNQTLHIS